jgi:hypothetical protein
MLNLTWVSSLQSPPPPTRNGNINIVRYIPGHIHAFYLEYVYYDRKESAREGRYTATRAPGVYSERVQTGGQSYGTIVQPTN